MYKREQKREGMDTGRAGSTPRQHTHIHAHTYTATQTKHMNTITCTHPHGRRIFSDCEFQKKCRINDKDVK